MTSLTVAAIATATPVNRKMGVTQDIAMYLRTIKLKLKLKIAPKLKVFLKPIIIQMKQSMLLTMTHILYPC
jgi:hypothetical protein